MRAARLLPLAALALAACGSPQPTVLENEAARATSVADLKGWDRLFGVPDEAIAHVGQFGFRASPYAADGGSYLTTGGPVMLAGSTSTRPSEARFEAAGTGADRFDRVVFTGTVSDPADADTARRRLADIVRQFLFQYGIDDEDALDAVVQAESADGMIGPVPVSIAVAETGDGTATITVTFTRPAASTPGNPQAQG